MRKLRVLYLSGYTHSAHHRKVELLADAADVDILHLNWPESGKPPGVYPSASGQRTYRSQVVSVQWLGRVGDPHRVIHRSLHLDVPRFKPDLIHCEQEQEGLMAAQVALVRDVFAAGVPLILYSWQNLLRARAPHVKLICDYTLRAAQHILCASTEAVVVLRLQGYKGSTSVMPMFGLDTRYFYPKDASPLRAKLGLSGFVVGFMGRLSPEKGLDTLLHAMANTPSQIQLLLVGDGPQQAELGSLTETLGLQARCQFVAAVPYDQVVDYLNVIDLLVLPSRTTTYWKEQFGRVLIEAMACKVLVIGSDSGAISEVIGDKNLVFPEGDSMALASLITRLFEHPAQRTKLVTRAYKQVQERFGIPRLATGILDVWHQLTS